MCNHDNDRNRQIGLVLLMLNTPVHRDRSIKSMGGGNAQQIAVAAASLSHLLDRVYFKLTGEKRFES